MQSQMILQNSSTGRSKLLELLSDFVGGGDASVDLSKPLHTGQVEVYEDDTRFRVMACGRRFGKTELGKREIIEVARNGGYAWWVSPTAAMAHDVWKDLIRETVNLRSGLSKSNREILFSSGGSLRVLSAHEPDRLRGAGLDFLIIDEAAFCHVDAWEILRPALSDKQGKALFLSTPKGRNWFWNIYKRGLDPEQKAWKSWQKPSSVNPFLAAQEIVDAAMDMPEMKFKQEYMAEFIEDSGSVFRNVSACIREPRTINHIPDGAIVFGVDWGRSNDFTAIVVLDTEHNQVVEIDRFQKIDWTLQRGRLKAMADRWRPRVILAESNSIGEPNIEVLRNQGLPMKSFLTTANSKPPLIDNLALAIENQEIGLIDDPVLINELQSYEMERMSSGNFRYNAPSGGHDDTVIALALALKAAVAPVMREWSYL